MTNAATQMADIACIIHHDWPGTLYRNEKTSMWTIQKIQCRNRRYLAENTNGFSLYILFAMLTLQFTFYLRLFSGTKMAIRQTIHFFDEGEEMITGCICLFFAFYFQQNFIRTICQLKGFFSL